MNTNNDDSLISHFKEILMQNEEVKPYSVTESVKSQLNIHIYNSRGHKKRIYVSIKLNKDASDKIFPQEYKGWILEEAKAQKKGNGVFLNYAYYVRDMTTEEIEEAWKEDMEDVNYEEDERVA